MFKWIWRLLFGCRSKLHKAGCVLKRGHKGNHRGPHWSGRTLYWRELDTNQIQELINAIRDFGYKQPIGNLREMSLAWQLVEERTARIQLCIDGSRTIGT